MLSLLLGLLMQLLVAIVLAALALFLLSLAGLVRFLPGIVRSLTRLLRTFLSTSVRLYAVVFTTAAPWIRRHLGVSILDPPWTICSAVALSLALGLLLLVALGLPAGPASVALLVLHGLTVGLLWSEVGDASGLDLGVKRPWDS